MDFDSSAALHFNSDLVMKGNGLVDRPQIVETVRPARADGEAEIDLREGEDGDGHGRVILTTEGTESHRGFSRDECTSEPRLLVHLDRKQAVDLRIGT